ncbi:hypothetical protein TNCT_5961, partial [Trichonephila clavata]
IWKLLWKTGNSSEKNIE